MTAAPAIAATEHEWMDAVVDIAHTWGWVVAHFRPARTQHGWRTAVGYDGKGFPDLVLVHPHRQRVIFAELKSDTGRLDDAQADWQIHLERAGADWRLWRPRDRAAVLDELTFGRAVLA